MVKKLHPDQSWKSLCHANSRLVDDAKRFKYVFGTNLIFSPNKTHENAVNTGNNNILHTLGLLYYINTIIDSNKPFYKPINRRQGIESQVWRGVYENLSTVVIFDPAFFHAGLTKDNYCEQPDTISITTFYSICKTLGNTIDHETAKICSKRFDVEDCVRNFIGLTFYTCDKIEIAETSLGEPIPIDLHNVERDDESQRPPIPTVNMDIDKMKEFFENLHTYEDGCTLFPSLKSRGGGGKNKSNKKLKRRSKIRQRLCQGRTKRVFRRRHRRRS